MRQIFFALACLVLTATAVFADADIPIKYRVANQDPGYCAWACLETMCRHQGIKSGYDMLENRKLDAAWVRRDGTVWANNFGDDDAITWKLKRLGIKYRMNPTDGNTNEGLDLIKFAVKEGHGAMIGVKFSPLALGEHAITVIALDENNFSYIDPNNTKTEYVGSKRWLFDAWDRLVVTLEK